jgi:protein tyrosine phosphatase (PTP) superfamily phosphohydrolase (DUF442 family)
MAEVTDIYNFLPLTDTLLTSGQPTEEQFSAVARAGVQTVINLALSTSTNALRDEAGLVKSLGMEYYHFPVIWDKPSREALDQFMDVMDSHAGRKMFVHCAANMRVCTFVALYRILRLGWSHDKAFKDVYRIWDPYEDEGWRKFIKSALATKK